MNDHDPPRLVFDRGTLVFRGRWPIDLARLPGVLWDPRVQTHRAPACLWPQLAGELARLEVHHRDEVRRPMLPLATWAPLELRPYQEAALRAWHVAGRRGLIVLPTGAGKTRTAIAAIARAGTSALCVVPTRVLLEQWRSELAKVYGGPIGCLGDGAHELAPITVATYESAYRHVAELGDRFDLLVVDEAHHLGGTTRDELLELSIAPARLGLTATPPTGPPAAALARILGPVVYELAVRDLAGEFLADFEVVVLRLELTPDERAAYERDHARFKAVHARFRQFAPDASWSEFARAAGATDEGRAALAAWRRVRDLLAFTRAKSDVVAGLVAKHRDARVLVFTADNVTAYELARRHLVMPLTCDIARAERDEVLAKFREGKLRALVSARVLNEGIDVPDADVAVVVGGALGKREHVQRVGRLLRPVPGKRALVYELVTRGTIEERQQQRRSEALGVR